MNLEPIAQPSVSLGWFISDPRRDGGYPQGPLDYTPCVETGFMWWDREYREIRDVHHIANGHQIELYC